MHFRSAFKPVLAAGCLSALSACASAPPAQDPHPGIRWVRSAAEFEAICLQVYHAAGEFLEVAVADTGWSALPGQVDADGLPTAILFDVDETLVSNAEFQATFEPPFTNAKLDDWNAAGVARPIPGAADFARLARASGVELFFITNRPCEAKLGVGDPCPQQAVTIRDLAESGIPADPEHVLMANERPEWDREKALRREFVAQTHRVIMLVGDDLGDFIPCTRRRPLAPCDEGATVASRRDATYDYREYWGAGWFILPNPMHGSWTTVH